MNIRLNFDQKGMSLDAQLRNALGEEEYNERLEMLRSALDGIEVERETDLMGIKMPSVYRFSDNITFDTPVSNLVLRGKKNEYNNNVLKKSDQKEDESNEAFAQRIEIRKGELQQIAETGGLSYDVEESLSRTFGTGSKKKEEDPFVKNMRIIKFLVSKKNSGTATQAELEQLKKMQQEFGLI